MQESFLTFLGENLQLFLTYTGVYNATPGHLIMILVGLLFIFLAIKYEFEPMLLIPIGFGILIGNIPFKDAGLQVGIYEQGSVLRRGRHGDLLREVVVSEERYGHVVFAALKSGDIGLAVEARSVILGIGAAVGEFEFDDRTRNALLGLGVDDGHRNLAVLRVCGGSKAGNEKCCQKSLHA